MNGERVAGDEIRLVLVDDHQSFLDAFATRLEREPDMHVVGTATDAEHARRAVASTHPTVVVVDADLGDDDGIELCEELDETSKDTAIVVLTGADTRGMTRRAVAAGVVSIVHKGADVSALVNAVRGAPAGDSFFPAHGTRELIEDYRRLLTQVPLDDQLRALSEREYEILRYLAGGCDRSTIADRLCLSVNTVRTHVRRIFQKIGVHSQLEAAAVARKAGVKPLH